MKLLRPPRLNPGDTLGIIAPASAPPDPKNVDRAIAVLEKLGYKIKLAPNVHKRWGYLAGSDRERADDLMRMFTDKKVSAILCVRGGYGTARLLPLLDYRTIRTNAKIFVGYSDITSLHCAFLTKAGLVSFHGPMLNSEFALADLPDFTVQSFLRTLASSYPRPAKQGAAQGEGQSHNIAENYPDKTVQLIRRGVARGHLIGGNLALLCTVIGTPWQPSFQNAILWKTSAKRRIAGIACSPTSPTAACSSRSPASPSASMLIAKTRTPRPRRNIARPWAKSSASDSPR